MTTGTYGPATAIADTDEIASTHLSAHTSARSPRIEVIRTERRRRWPLEQKRAIVTETRIPGASLAGIARKHGIGTGLLYSWRRRFPHDPPALAPDFARVEMTEFSAPLLPASILQGTGFPGLIEITLPGGASVRVDAKVDERASRRVLRVLRER
jgi:transposase